MNVADQRVTALLYRLNSFPGLFAEERTRFIRIGNLVHANIDNCGARLDIISADESRASNRGHENICLAGRACQISRARMANRYGRILPQQSACDGTADYLAGADL